MNQQSKKTGKDGFLFFGKPISWIETQSLPSLLRRYSSRLYLLSRKSLSSIPVFLISISALLAATSAVAGDAVAIGYNKDGIWTSVTYYCSSKAKGGKDYKTEAEAREEASRDLHKRGDHQTARFEILSSSDATGFVAVGRGADTSGKDTNVVGRGNTQAEADQNATAELKRRGATKNQKIVYRYFSHGADGK